LIKTQGLTHIQLSVRDLGSSIGFYKSVFGMEVDVSRSDETLVFLRTPGARDTITFRQAQPGEVVGSGGGLEHIGFRLQNRADLEAALSEVTAAGGKVLERGEHAPGLHYAYVSDPDGYVIEF
jgi:catechol 2,3-dioxygenase-like lactoylglutathione lyase family enzyme